MENIQTNEKRSFADKLRRVFYSPGFKIGFAFIVGVFVGFLIFTVFEVNVSGTKVTKENASGTMWDSRSFDQMTVADNLMFENSACKATFEVRYSTRIVEMHITISSLNATRTIITFDPSSFRVYAVQNMNPNDQSQTIGAANFVQIDNIGENVYVVVLYNANNLPHQIGFLVSQNDNMMWQNSVTVNKE